MISIQLSTYSQKQDIDLSIDVSCGPLHLNWKPDTILDIKNYFIIIDNQLEKITKEKKTNNNNNNNINDSDNNNNSSFGEKQTKEACFKVLDFVFRPHFNESVDPAG